MKLLCPKCSSECDVSGQGQSTLTCPSCGLALFISTSIRGRLSSTRMGQVSQSPEAGGLLLEAPDRGDNRLSPLPQTVNFVGEALPQVPELALVPQFLGRYEIVEFLGAGSFSRVYLAKDSQLGRLVALKVPKSERFDRPEDLATFLREARTIAGLDHPGIVSVYDVATESSGVQFIVMQYVPGMTLQDRMALGSMTYWEAADIVCRVSEAIHTAHKRQVFHRDLKPANILLDTEGRPHVADFGLAVLEHLQQQHAGEVAGTLIYMAPEQIRGEAQWLDGRSDIWSLGAIFYSLLTGRHPFLGKGKKVSDEILYREPRPPRQIDERIPKELEQICLKCLTKSVRERYFSAFDLAEDIKNWMRTVVPAFSPSSSSSRSSEITLAAEDSIRRPPPSTHYKLIASGMIAALALMLGVVGANHLSKGNSSDSRASVPGLLKTPTAEPLLKPTPFELDSYAVTGRWNPLLEVKPQVLTFAPNYETARWSHDQERQEVLLDVPAPAYLEFGQTEATDFTLETVIASTNWRGHVGLFWGRKDAPSEPGAKLEFPRCHVVYLYLYQEKGQPAARLQRDQASFHRNADKSLALNDSTPISCEIIPLPGTRPMRLEVQVRGDVVKVYWNSEYAEGITLVSIPKQLPRLSAADGFGVYATRGSFQLSDTRIRLDGNVPRPNVQK